MPINPWGNLKPPAWARQNWDHPLSKGLVGHWLFNEGSGPVVRDIARGNTGTLTNGTTWALGKFDKTLNFDGATNYVSVPDNDAHTPALISLACWVYYVSQGGTSLGMVISKYDNSTSNRSYTFGMGTGDTLGGYLSNNGAGFTPINEASLGAVPKNQWSHIALTYDGANMGLYLNGRKSTTSNPFTGNIFNSSTILALGARPVGTTGWFGGKVEDVRIYNRPLRQSEVVSLYSDPFADITAPSRRIWASSAAAPGGFQAAWARNRSHVIGAGAR